MKENSFVRYYRNELQTVGIVFLAILALSAFLRYKSVIMANLFAENSWLILLGCVVGGVVGAAIRIYYRVMVLRYTTQKSQA